MIETFRPWVGLALGLMLLVNGMRMLTKPNSYVGVGLIPASDPRTVRAFGIFTAVVGILSVGVNAPYLFSE